MPSTPHNDLHPAARDYTQKEGREESHCDLRVKHCHCPRETPVLRSRPRSLQILLMLNLMIWNAAVYSTLVVRDVVLAELL